MQNFGPGYTGLLLCGALSEHAAGTLPSAVCGHTHTHSHTHTHTHTNVRQSTMIIITHVGKGEILAQVFPEKKIHHAKRMGDQLWKLIFEQT